MTKQSLRDNVREPDPEGLAFWKSHYEDGMPLSEVIRYIENSDEANA